MLSAFVESFGWEKKPTRNERPNDGCWLNENIKLTGEGEKMQRGEKLIS